jgi:hypothetical protein
MKEKLLFWTPRILCILAILFISMFALDAFDPALTLGQQLAGFAIHLIPSFVLVALLVVAWRWEFIGGIVFLIIGLGFTPLIYLHNFNMNHSVWISLSIVLLITFPFIVVGLLFLLHHRLKNKNLTLS